MKKKIAIIGASIGGLVAAAELKYQGFEVSIIEKGSTIGGLYSSIDTPFGEQELGMHVLYLTNEHYKHLCDIFGKDVFDVFKGYKVDIAGTYNFGKLFFNSCYPDIRDFKLREQIFEEIKLNNKNKIVPKNAKDILQKKFGEIAENQIFSPILEKLWKQKSKNLSCGSIFCFCDLRRVVICEKAEADVLKKDIWFDQVIGNPLQDKPSGLVFDGRLGVRFKKDIGQLLSRVKIWLKKNKVIIYYNAEVKIKNNKLLLNNKLFSNEFDGCIVSSPLASIIESSKESMNFLELSIFYFELENDISSFFPSYYVLCFDKKIKSTRIVNYNAYDKDKEKFIISVEVMHEIGKSPDVDHIIKELKTIIPFAEIKSSYKTPLKLFLPIPSLKNQDFLTKNTDLLVANNNTPLYFTGMRTDKGVFFSHTTIGLAHEAALEYSKKFS